MRSSTYYIAGFGGEEFNTDWDITYHSRGRRQNSERSARAFTAFTSILKGRQTLPHRVLGTEEKVVDRFIDILTTSPDSSCVLDMPTSSKLKYDAEWVKSVTNFTPESWCNMHSVFQRKVSKSTKFQRAAWLAAIAYASGEDSVVLDTLLAISTIPSFTKVPIPKTKSFIAREKCNPDSDSLRDIVQLAWLQFGIAPEQNLARGVDESGLNIRSRCNEALLDRQEKYTAAFVENIMAQWPCDTPERPSEDRFSKYINVDVAMRRICQKFEIYNGNTAFRAYLKTFAGKLLKTRVQSIQFADDSLEMLPYISWDVDRFVDFGRLMQKARPIDIPSLESDSRLSNIVTSEQVSVQSKLTAVIQKLTRNASTPHHLRYISRLQESMACLTEHSNKFHLTIESNELLKLLILFRDQSLMNFHEVFQRIQRALIPSS